MQYSLVSLAATFGMVAATAVDLSQVSGPLSVSLTPMGNHIVKATIKNTASKGYNIFTRGSIFDSSPVQKVHVSHKDTKLKFHGIKIKTSTTNLSEDAFTPLAAGESKEIMINMAEIYDFSESSVYDILGHGRLRYAEMGSTELTKDALVYSTSPLSMNIDGAIASKVAKAIDVSLNKRASTSNDCTADQKKTVTQALSGCYDQATAAADAALNGSADKFKEYFKSTSSKDRQYVSDRFTAVAKECNNSPGGDLTIHCKDIHNDCRSGDFAYTTNSDDTVVWCGSYYSASLESNSCHDDDKVGTTIHEFTHAEDVFSPGTDDWAYGYDDCYALPRSKALENADTYEYYANAIYVGC